MLKQERPQITFNKIYKLLLFPFSFCCQALFHPKNYLLLLNTFLQLFFKLSTKLFSQQIALQIFIYHCFYFSPFLPFSVLLFLSSFSRPSLSLPQHCQKSLLNILQLQRIIVDVTDENSFLGLNIL